MTDVGELLFREILRMSEYPGSPFTGVIIDDLIRYFLIPTIFIILIIYMAVGRVVGGHRGLRILVGLGAYLYIIVSGYYAVFARLAGPYFIFLIFVLGLLYFILEHFSRRAPPAGGGGGPYRSGGGMSSTGNPYPSQTYDTDARDRLVTLEREIKEVEDAAMKFKKTLPPNSDINRSMQPFAELLAKLAAEAASIRGGATLQGKIDQFMKKMTKGL